VKELQRRGDPNVVIALAGNKADMDNKRKVNTEEAQQYAQDNQIIFMETSAKTAFNVKALFTEIGKIFRLNFLVLMMIFSKQKSSLKMLRLRRGKLFQLCPRRRNLHHVADCYPRFG
jgi:hypothetical protein